MFLGVFDTNERYLPWYRLVGKLNLEYSVTSVPL